MDQVEIEEAKAGDLIAVSGMEDISVGETVVDPAHPDELPLLRIDEPTLQMTFRQNDSPFAGREGKFVTARQIEDRLLRELHTDVSLRVEDTGQAGSWLVSGRGELHLSILIENMRREGFELQASRPQVIFREENGQTTEPYESIQIDTPDEYSSAVIDSLNQRKGEMQNMEAVGNGQTRLTYMAPSRGLIGYATEFMTTTHGYGIYNHTFAEYRPKVNNWEPGRRNGALVSINQGPTTNYAIMGVEDRGQMFIGAGVDVYEGMVVGMNSRDNDISVNVTKMKPQSNVRSSNKDQTASIKTPREMNLEASMEFLNDDEYVEVTPENVRIRKAILNTAEREKAAKRRNK
ncbi:GTP-binding protein TypA [Fructobacillus ficulneus]|uniref:GTP-binding protein TypA n=1 Tax=Fructobacillus ficulneus TaxID=157463 RepID=A0A0K8MK25_9LACO|nr:GTP-binding protein TypA [Fructobacillus ficulneus]